MPITSQPQADMYGVQMNGSGMGAEYQTGTNVGANVQSQVSSKGNCLSISCNRGLTLLQLCVDFPQNVKLCSCSGLSEF